MSSSDKTIARTPTEVGELLGACLRAGDVDGALALYDPQASFVAEPGAAPLVGPDAIRGGLVGFAALRPTITSELKWTQESGDIALVVHNWTMEATGPDGEPMHVEGAAADVMRRGDDGGWRYLIDYPWSAT